MADALADIAERKPAAMSDMAIVVTAALGAGAAAIIGAWWWSGRGGRALMQRTSDRLAPRGSGTTSPNAAGVPAKG